MSAVLMGTPKRIQRKRTKGWRMPEGAVYVGRPGRWGNPYRIGDAYMVHEILDFPLPTNREPGKRVGATDAEVVLCESAEQAVCWYRAWLEVATGDQAIDPLVLADLRGHDLACWCPLDSPCHADVLLEIANRSPND